MRSGAVSAQTIHILLVEDEEAHAELVHRGVESCGGSIRLTVARSLQEARAKLQVFSPDLLIADLKLPDGSGLELLPPENEKPSYPIVMLTSHGDEASAVAALKGGAMDYLVKSAATLSDIPFIAGRILREWGHITERRRAEEALQKAYGELELRVKERTADLLRTNAALEEQITERNRAEQALRRGKHKYESLMNQSPDPIFVSRIDDFKFTEVSDRACENYGYSREEFLTMEIFDIEIEVPLRQEVRDLYRKMEVGQVVEVYGMNKRKDGSTFPVQVRFTKLDNEYAVAVVSDITVRKEAEDRIAASLKEKELLLKEVHHRVKNNLQIISSILDLQCEHIKSEVGLEVIRGCQHRIRSIALIHEDLCQSDSLSRIDFSEYIESLTAQLFNVYGPSTDSIQLKTHLQKDVLLGIDTAIPCGLIIHELLSNALKYAFPESRRGKIRIEFYSDSAGRLNLIIADDGVGLPNTLDFHHTETLGLQLVVTLVDQLDGCIDLHNGSGTEFKIQFSDSKGF